MTPEQTPPAMPDEGARPLRFDPRIAKQWWQAKMGGSFVSARLGGDGYVKFRWKDDDEDGAYSVPWVTMSDDMCALATREASPPREGVLREALRACRDQFAFYVGEHTRAGKHEKAATNQAFVDRADAALALAANPLPEADPFDVVAAAVDNPPPASDALRQFVKQPEAARRDDGEVARDAARWRALMSSDRVRMMGAAGFDFADDGTIAVREASGVHLGMEVWDKHPARGDKSDVRGRALLLAYVDHRVALAATDPVQP